MGEPAEKLEQQSHLLVLMREMDEELRHIFLGSVLKRIRVFAEKWDSDADPRVLTREVERDFVKDDNHEFMIIIAVKEARVVGHLLARVLDYYGRRYVNVHQMDIDANAGVTLEQEKQALSWIVGWKNDLRANGIRSLVPDQINARRLKIMYGFTPMYTIMKLEEGQR